MPMPSPDWDAVTLKWAGTYLDGTPCKGYLTLTYNGGVQLDDSTTLPVNIYPLPLNVPITTKDITIDGDVRQVGYAEVQVPASNDPDIKGSGGTYTLTESLSKGGGRQNASFVADINAPAGVIWLNKIIPTTPVPAQPLSVVYYSDFETLKSRVDLKANLAGDTFTGPVTIDGSDFTIKGDGKAYRFRRSGGGLDYEAGGTDLVFSMWTNPDFSGEQFMYDKFTYWQGRAMHTARREFVTALFGGTVQHVIDPVQNTTGWYGATPVGRQVVTGSRSNGTALESLLIAMTNLGWIDNQTTG